MHTCDTFLKPNREIWNFWSGNLCLVSGGFHVANFGPFLPKLKSRNLVTFLEICYRASQCQHMPTKVRICVRLQFKKPPTDIIVTRTFILVLFRFVYKFTSFINSFVKTGSKKYLSK